MDTIKHANLPIGKPTVAAVTREIAARIRQHLLVWQKNSEFLDQARDKLGARYEELRECVDWHLESLEYYGRIANDSDQPSLFLMFEPVLPTGKIEGAPIDFVALRDDRWHEARDGIPVNIGVIQCAGADLANPDTVLVIHPLGAMTTSHPNPHARSRSKLGKAGHRGEGLIGYDAARESFEKDAAEAPPNMACLITNVHQPPRSYAGAFNLQHAAACGKRLKGVLDFVMTFRDSPFPAMVGDGLSFGGTTILQALMQMTGTATSKIARKVCVLLFDIPGPGPRYRLHQDGSVERNKNGEAILEMGPTGPIPMTHISHMGDQPDVTIVEILREDSVQGKSGVQGWHSLTRRNIPRYTPPAKIIVRTGHLADVENEEQIASEWKLDSLNELERQILQSIGPDPKHAKLSPIARATQRVKARIGLQHVASQRPGTYENRLRRGLIKIVAAMADTHRNSELTNPMILRGLHETLAEFRRIHWSAPRKPNAVGIASHMARRVGPLLGRSFRFQESLRGLLGNNNPSF